MPDTSVINVRIPDELLKDYEERILPREREKTGIRTLSRNEIIVKALEQYAKGEGV